MPENAIAFLDSLEMQLSIISRIDLLAWPKIGHQQLNELNGFNSISRAFNLAEDVVLKTIEIRKLYSIKLPDAIIAATALANNLILITRNTADFKKIENLEVLNPWAIS